MNATDILIYTPKESARLHYILHWIFVEQWQQSFTITQDIAIYKSFIGIKINYSNDLLEEGLTIKPHALLFEEGIQPQLLNIQRWKKTTVLFYNQPKGKVPFDIFAAAFFLLSRYEEYWQHKVDFHGRFKVSNSIAFQYQFLDVPLIDIWIQHFAFTLNTIFNSKVVTCKQFMYKPTYDIDIAWAYRNRSKIQILLGGVKELLTFKWKPLLQRWTYFKQPSVDPYDSFQSLETLHQSYNIKATYFWLLALNKSKYDRNANPQSKEMQLLIQEISKNNTLGIHPSYQSNFRFDSLLAEKSILESIEEKTIVNARQHYIKLKLPTTYHNYLNAGIVNDYSMGYPDAQGFRASTCQSFLWFDLENNTVTSLRVHPFVFMDATAIFYKKQSPELALKEFERLLLQVKQVNGTFISIMHNYTLGTAVYHKGWMQVYQKMLAMIFGY